MNLIINGATRREQVGSIEYLVAPVVAARAGKLNEPVSAEELSAHFMAWNGTPFVLGHPTDGTGEHISANDPRLLDQIQLGNLFNVQMDGDKLKGEVWVNLAWAEAVQRGREVVERLEKGDPLEVSTAYFRDVQNGAARNLRPDHLAALLDVQGACSWQDGCGAPRVNCEDDMEDAPEQEQAPPALLELEPGDGELTHNSLRSAWGKITRALGFNQQESTMEELIQAILDDGRMELNAEELGAMTERQLTAVAKLLQAEQEPEPEPEPQEEPEPEPVANAAPCPNLVAFMAEVDKRGGPTAVFAQIDRLAANEAERRTKLIADLVANERCVLDARQLGALDADALLALGRSFIAPDYSGNGGGERPPEQNYSVRVNSTVPVKE